MDFDCFLKMMDLQASRQISLLRPRLKKRWGTLREVRRRHVGSEETDDLTMEDLLMIY